MFRKSLFLIFLCFVIRNNNAVPFAADDAEGRLYFSQSNSPVIVNSNEDSSDNENESYGIKRSLSSNSYPTNSQSMGNTPKHKIFNVVRRNYLRFGKRDPNPSRQLRVPISGFPGLERRDYREFVRFGKRAPSKSNFDESEMKSPKSFLRFGKRNLILSNPEIPENIILDPIPEDILSEALSLSNKISSSSMDKRTNDYLRFGK